MPTLYRKYRPQTFADLVGQDYIVQTITNQILLNKLAHAYLFSGPRGTGKTTLARLLAKAANCKNKKPGTFEPCDECSTCQEIAASRNVDVIEIDAASQTGVDNVRENIVENAQFKPTKSQYKIFIIDEVHMLSTSAFNALLKTLEEPPLHVIFILATTELHKLPTTIISRCQRYNFRKIPYEVMKERLEKLSKEENITIENKVLDRIITKSEGCLRDAESLLGQIISLNIKKIKEEDISIILPSSNHENVFQFIELIIERHGSEALQFISQIASQGAHLEQFAIQCIELLRDLLIVKTTSRMEHLSTIYSEKHIKQIKNLSIKIENSELVFLIDTTFKRKQEIKTAPLPQLPLELLIVEYCSQPTTSNISPSLSSITQPTSPVLSSTVPSENKNETHNGITQSIKTALSHLTGKHNPPSTTIEQIKEKWEIFIQNLSATSHSLTFIVRMCTIENIDETGLKIKVPYEFHKEKLYEHKNKKIIEQALEQTYGEKIPFICDVESSSSTTEVASETTLLTNLANDFGGEIVN